MLNELDYLIWGSTLGIIVFVIVPLAWSLLYKTLTHTRSINRYSFEMLVCGLSIASNTEIVNSMEKTLNSSEKIISHTQSLKKIAKTL
jgi:hypothetical protein|tara:strand:- start:608 stop:871 length:264 start_codon:yes stop_codon:yes gene_type:complete